MNIYFQAFSNHAIAIFRENILPTLTTQQKRICIVASIALGFLAACYLANRYFCKFQPSDSKLSQKTVEQVYEQVEEQLEEIEQIATEIEIIQENLIEKETKQPIIHVPELDLENWENLFHTLLLSLKENNDPTKQEAFWSFIKNSGCILNKLDLTNIASNNAFSKEELKKILSACPNLKELRLGYATPDLESDILKILPTSIQHLDLRAKITTKDLDYLKSLPNLQSLNLRNECINRDYLKKIKAFSHLQSLGLSLNTDITDNDLKDLKDLSNLQYLELYYCQEITAKGLKHLQAFSALKHLELDDCGFSNDGLKHLTTLSHLQTLELCYYDIDLKHLTTLSQLQSLSLKGCKIIGGLQSLTALSDLQSLNLTYSQGFSGHDLEQLKTLSHLKSLILHETYMQDSDVAHLKELSHLQSLDLSVNSISDDSLEHLKTLSDLQSLNLNNCNISKGLEHLTTLSHLHSLDLSYCSGLIYKELIPLNKISTLRSLNLKYCNIDSLCLKMIRESLPLCHVIN